MQGKREKKNNKKEFEDCIDIQSDDDETLNKLVSKSQKRKK